VLENNFFKNKQGKIVKTPDRIRIETGSSPSNQNNSRGDFSQSSQRNYNEIGSNNTAINRPTISNNLRIRTPINSVNNTPRSQASRRTENLSTSQIVNPYNFPGKQSRIDNRSTSRNQRLNLSPEASRFFPDTYIYNDDNQSLPNYSSLSSTIVARGKMMVKPKGNPPAYSEIYGSARSFPGFNYSADRSIGNLNDFSEFEETEEDVKINNPKLSSEPAPNNSRISNIQIEPDIQNKSIESDKGSSCFSKKMFASKRKSSRNSNLLTAPLFAENLDDSIEKKPSCFSLGRFRKFFRRN
jgi:hypothetical protein